MLFIDASGSGSCDLSLIYTDFTSSGASPNNPHNTVVGVSLGEDGKIGTGGNGKYEGSDDVIDWRGK
jgi:hypothetical protein